MSTAMFCFQCEQTAGCTSCTGSRGVCGKDAVTANAQDELTAALIDLARTTTACSSAPSAHALLTEGLFATLTNVNFDAAHINDLLAETKQRTAALVSTCPHTATEPFDMNAIWQAPEDERSLKSLILFGLRGMAAYAYHARVLGYANNDADAFFTTGLATLATEHDTNALLSCALQLGAVNLSCMQLLDQANTETYGFPAPVQVARNIEPGPFIVVSGHDLHDLDLLLQQTKNRGINVYTHGEMLPAHAYPKLGAYPHLKGNIGTAWQNQQREFDALPAPILFTTNCLMPPTATYADRVFTTGTVAFPEATHIGADKDFTPLITKALELGGFTQGDNNASHEGTFTTGFGRETVLNAAGQVVEGVKSGQIRHIFLVGGCDGARKERDYYTEFVRATPSDTLVLTLGCGKYRFNDLDLGTVAGLPRLLDMGQCNDAYGAIAVASALAEAFECGVNDLPLSLVLSWYEQKAVCILLTLLHLGISGIRLGPTLPAFVSKGVLSALVENFKLAPVTTPEQDLADLLG